jgi:hypothetical protein
MTLDSFRIAKALVEAIEAEFRVLMVHTTNQRAQGQTRMMYRRKSLHEGTKQIRASSKPCVRHGEATPKVEARAFVG